MVGWVVRFGDGKRVFVQAEDIQDAIRQGHKDGGPKYSLRDIVEVRMTLTP